jgi:Nif-specific regulatory protein/two-component system response regulator AtoC
LSDALCGGFVFAMAAGETPRESGYRRSLPVEVPLGSDISQGHDGAPLRQIKREALHKAELAAIEEALTRFQGNVSAIARAMGITPRAVHMKLRTYQLKADAYRR